MDSRKRQKNKQWYSTNAKKPRRAFSLGPDQKGFLVSCNFREKEAIRESYILLNEFADKLYGPEIPEHAIDVNNDDDDVDIEVSMEKEKEALKAQTNKKEHERRFQVVESSVKNILFIRTTVAEPVKIVKNILDSIEISCDHKARNVLRMVPIQQTCKAYEKPILETLKALLEPHFLNQTNQTSYVLIFKCHHHNTITKMQVIEMVCTLVKEMNPNAQVDYKNPDLAINVDIIKDTACCSVVPRYYHYKKYNLGEWANFVKKLKDGENGIKSEENGKDIKNPEPVKVDDDIKLEQVQNSEPEAKDIEKSKSQEEPAENAVSKNVDNSKVKSENVEKLESATDNVKKLESATDNVEKTESVNENAEESVIKSENIEKSEGENSNYIDDLENKV